MQWIRDHQPDPERKKAFQSALIITLAGNILLAVAKGLAASISGSVALYADAANSISDVIYAIAMVIGLRMVLQPPDLSHPQGHARFEPLVGLIVALMMGIAGYEAFRSSLERFFTGGGTIDISLPTIVLFASAGVKIAMFYTIRRLAARANSTSLQVTAKDNLSDALASFAALAGILGSQFIHPIFDPLAGLLVALWIFKAAFEAGKENLGFLTGAGADDDLRQRIINITSQVEGVSQVHHMMSEYVGPQLVVDLHINLPGDTSLDEVHEVTDRVIETLEALPEIDRAYVHVEPLDEQSSGK